MGPTAAITSRVAPPGRMCRGSGAPGRFFLPATPTRPFLPGRRRFGSGPVNRSPKARKAGLVFPLLGRPARPFPGPFLRVPFGPRRVGERLSDQAPCFTENSPERTLSARISRYSAVVVLPYLARMP
ncbi:hypothetical protein AZA_11645 [Nitrospirillum viridazoti Y2]|nr:hypothetical protein AZA_11645 [Nitrospirillum amazonense Y2]